MKRLNRTIAAFTAVAVLLGAISISAFAASIESEAGIVFLTGDTEIIPDPDPELPDISNADLDFGEHKLSSKKETYSSVEYGANGKKYAGFLLNAPNYNGWNVTVKISEFKIVSGDPTMKGFELKLVPWNRGPITTADNAAVSAPPEAFTRTLTAGASDNIFAANKSKGFGKWGCNWEGYLDVPGGSALEGIAKATMLWSLSNTPSTP